MNGEEAGVMWKPWGAQRHDGVPVLGALVADEHRVWQVVDIRALGAGVDCPSARTHQLVLEARTGEADRRQVQTNSYGAWWTYPGRFPVCSCCGEPPPCRGYLVEVAALAELARMRRFEIGGVCPVCGEPVETGQESVSFQTNLEVPLGPPVSFHLQPSVCRRGASDYERRLRGSGCAALES